VLGGSFDHYAQTAKGKRGASAVDEEFLKEIEGWRDTLARNLALRNPPLGLDDLNDAVQRLIDRIIFLRMAEDRGMEEYGRLQRVANPSPAAKSAAEEGSTFKQLIELSRLADAKYNSGLFDPRLPHSQTLERLLVDDKTLRPILAGLYPPDCPYEFSQIPAEILGNVYEQFLGKVIRLTAGHQAKVEEKPEVEKAGGVYYTPAYIVEYIVQHTVGVAVAGRTPQQLKGFRCLDPACGSGGFLLGAYSYLLDYYRDWYSQHDPAKHREAVTQVNGGWQLTIAERKRLLTEHIFGVDIDRQAVEVTKLSLLLKVLEGAKQMELFSSERALPNLDRNIKCGNSLIGLDYFGAQLLPDDDELKRVNPFDWQREFPETMRAGGFDCVIGNPPYGASFGEREAEYFLGKYKVCGRMKDVYTCFIERSLSLWKSPGEFSFIVPSAWLGGPEYTNLRVLFLSRQIKHIRLLPFDIFADAYVDTAIFVISNQPADVAHQVRTYTYGKRDRLSRIELSNGDYKLISQGDWDAAPDKKFVLDPSAVHILERLRQSAPLIVNDVVQIKRGVLFDKELLTRKKTSAASHRYFEGDVYRYELNPVLNQWVEFGDDMRERPKEFFWFEGARLLLRRLVNRRQRLMAAFASDTFITNKNLYSVRLRDAPLNVLAVLGVLNSRLISYLYINQVTQATKDDFPQVTIKDVGSLPIPDLRKDKARHDKLVALVEKMLDLQKRKAGAGGVAEQERLLRLIDDTDAQIDALVYALYGLTADEIAVVEGQGKPR